MRSLRVQCSSTAPEEKKNTSYGVMAAPSNAIAKNAYVAQLSDDGGPNRRADAKGSANPGPSRHRATAVTTSARPERPNTFSMMEKRTFHRTIQTAMATSGTQSR